MELTICPLASGSSGNALYIGDDRAGLLLDCGLSGRELERRLHSIGKNPSHIKGIILTHEHRDHAHGAGILARRWSLPLYTRPGTWEGAEEILGPIPLELIRELEPGLTIGQIELDTFPLPHDAREPVGIVMHWRGRQIVVATDLGHSTSRVEQCLKEADVMILEANHDRSMLENGPYPPSLKRRIRGERGHLSNDDCGELLAGVLRDASPFIYLAHLSKENNSPQVAWATVANILRQRGIEMEARSLMVAEREKASPITQITSACIS